MGRKSIITHGIHLIGLVDTFHDWHHVEKSFESRPFWSHTLCHGAWFPCPGSGKSTPSGSLTIRIYRWLDTFKEPLCRLNIVVNIV